MRHLVLVSIGGGIDNVHLASAMEPRITAVYVLRILLAVCGVLSLCLFPQGCNDSIYRFLRRTHLLFVHVEAQRLACLLVNGVLLQVSRSAVVVLVAALRDVRLLHLARPGVVLRLLRNNPAVLSQPHAIVATAKRNTGHIQSHVRLGEVHAVVSTFERRLHTVSHLLHLVNHRLSLCRCKWLVFLPLCRSRTWRRIGGGTGSRRGRRSFGRLCRLGLRRRCRCLRLHCVHSQTLAEFLIRWAFHGSVRFQCVVKLQTVLITLFAGSEHLAAEVLTALADRTVFFQCVVQFVYLVVWHIL